MAQIDELPRSILEQIKSNELTPPNTLKVITRLPVSITYINDDLTLKTHPMLCSYLDMKIVVIYIDIPGDEQGTQAIDAFLIE
jgi:hypothetical protein